MERKKCNELLLDLYASYMISSFISVYIIKGAIIMKHHNGRSSFSGKIGFVLSAAGASVGLGNI